jgi:2'-5' RNA ligase
MRTILSPEQPSFGPGFDTKPKYRLFFGILLDAGATDRSTRLMAQLRDDKIMPGRPVDADRLHITLHHLADFADQIPTSLAPSASAAAATIRMQPFNVTFDRVGGTRGPFLLRPSNGAVALREFRQALSVALIAAGLRNYVDPVFNVSVRC